MQQNSLSQKVTEAKMDGLKKCMEAKMDGMEAKMDGLKKGMEANMDGLNKGVEAKMNDMEAKMDGIEEKLKGNMEDLKTDLTKILQEMLTNGERVVKETHDENKRNFNHDFIDSNVGLKTHHVPKINMRNFDGKDPVTWILQMEQYFDLHNVQNTQKVRIATFNLEPNHFVLYRWLCSRKQIVTWTILQKK